MLLPGGLFSADVLRMEFKAQCAWPGPAIRAGQLALQRSRGVSLQVGLHCAARLQLGIKVVTTLALMNAECGLDTAMKYACGDMCIRPVDACQ